MICFWDSKPVTAADMKRRFEWRRWKDGTAHVYGTGAPDGPLSSARGELEKVSHYKCYHAWVKRQQLLDAKQADAPDQRETDWREQETANVEDLRPGESN